MSRHGQVEHHHGEFSGEGSISCNTWFARSSGRPVSRKELMRTVMERDFSPFDRSIDVHISNIRKKLGPSAEGIERIRSVRNHGYLYLSSLARSAKASEGNLRQVALPPRL